jgi:transcriptional regulator with XRE-family HTH domain
MISRYGRLLLLMITMTTRLPGALGDELRQARKRLGWTRRELLRRANVDISLQTLATYELGTRSISVTRLVELCAALGVTAHELLARATQAEPRGHLRLNLRAVLRTDRAELEPLRRWARVLLATTPDMPATTRLNPTATARMAELCGVGAGDLVALVDGSVVT